ncbi:MAG TPA: hypothetical protein VM884_05860 [Flavisolibacter sp.]|jgi:hypothetical protein|nr:hypothetical protein [Flavisolibacter sp.]
MSRQSFLSTEFFVCASEEEAKKAICSLPQHLAYIQLLKENTLAKSMRFLYQHPDKQAQNYVDVSILPLDSQYVCLILHASYTNGEAFHSDPGIGNTLRHFEQAVHAALKNDFSSLEVLQTAKHAKKRSGSFAKFFASIFLSKYPA